MYDAIEEVPDFEEALEHITGVVVAHSPHAREGEFKVALRFLISGPTRFYPTRFMTLIVPARRDAGVITLPDRARTANRVGDKLRLARRAYLN